MQNLRRLLLSISLALVAGCSFTPSSGPSTGAFVDAPSPLVVVEMDADIVTTLAQRSAKRLAAGPGDLFPTDGSGARLSIEVGDLVTVSVYESLTADPVASLFNRNEVPQQTVGRGGTITVPFIGRIKAAGRTREAVGREIRRKLGRKTFEPAVLVTVEKKVSNAVSVVGDATEGGQTILNPGSERLLDAIATAGGLEEPAHQVMVELTRDNRTAAMPFNAILRNPRHNVLLMPGDLIAVMNQPRSFVAAGATQRNTVVPMHEGVTTLIEGLSLAGGLLDSRANPSGLFVLRFEPRSFVTALYGSAPVAGEEVPVVYRFDFRLPEQLFLARRFLLRHGDILYVSNSTSVKVQKFLDLFRTTLSTGTQAASAGAF